MGLNKSLRILLLISGWVSLAGYMIGPIYALFVQKVGGDILDASLAGAVFALASGATMYAFGKFDDRVREHELFMALGYMIAGVGYLAYLWVGNVWMLLVVQIVIGFGNAVSAPAFDAAYSAHLSKNKGGSQWGVWEAMNQWVTAVGALIGGVVATAWGFGPLFVLMAIICFGSSLYVLRLPSRAI